MSDKSAAPMLDYVSQPWADFYRPLVVGVKQRPLFLLGGGSYYGRLFGPRIAELCHNVIAIADDQATEAALFGVPRWTFGEFLQKVGDFPDALAIDFWTGPLGEATLRKLAVDGGVESVDFVVALAELGLPTVYQTASEMRALTVHRQPEWAALRADLDDERSRRTLDAVLKLRLTYDRRHLRTVHASMEDEYFALYDTDTTFKLGDDETVCDAGAYVGTTVRKVVAATGGRFREIHAFEPDRANFSKLQELSSMRLRGLTLHNAAVGDYTGHVRFLETGTMGSHVESLDSAAISDGQGATAITRIDDAMDHLSFIKMDLEGFELRALGGAAGLIGSCRPRMAITGYHYADDLLELCTLLRQIAPGYSLRLRHHSSFYYDSILYAQPRERSC